MNNQERVKALKEREIAYYSLDDYLDDMRFKLGELKKHRGNSVAFRMLIIAIDVMQEQVKSDYRRYVRRLEIHGAVDELRALQKSHNRLAVRNKELEKKIEEAKTSSGLFIDFVRAKLGIK